MKKSEFSTPPGKAVLDSGPDSGNAGPAVLTSSPTLEAPADGSRALNEVIAQANQDILESLCPMCGWDQRERDVIEVTEEDKAAFVVAALGNNRFKKSYDRLGGKLKVIVRSRTYAEVEMISDQLLRWRDKENINAANMIYIKNWTYNMLIGLESVQVEGQAPKTYPEIATKMPKDKNADTPLEMAEKQTLEDWNEAVYSIIQSISRQFDQLVQKLTLHAHDPDFWKGTATPV